MLATATANTRTRVHAIRIRTLAEPIVVLAVDRNRPRVRATAQNRYEPGATTELER
jgi:hypothetical protein